LQRAAAAGATGTAAVMTVETDASAGPAGTAGAAGAAGAAASARSDLSCIAIAGRAVGCEQRLQLEFEHADELHRRLAVVSCRHRI